ncbi:hypothetical protein NUACC26_017450 [Scytonema sp. NUACC26]
MGRDSIVNMSAFTLQPVLIECVTNRLIQYVIKEIREWEIRSRYSIHLLKTHALVKANTKDYLKDIQIQLILNPIIQKLLSIFGSKERIEEQLMSMVFALRGKKPIETGYVCGNIVNIFRQLKVDFDKRCRR